MPFFAITNGFKEMTDAALSIRCRSILDSLSSNVHFPVPNPTLNTVEVKLGEFNQAAADAAGGDTAKKALRDQKKTELIDLLHALGRYVLYQSQNVRSVAISSGFHITREKQPKPDVAKAQNLRVTDGANAGELAMSFDTVPGAAAYLYQCTEDPVTENSRWKTEGGTVSHNVFAGLEGQKKYWVRVGAIGKKKQLVYSEPVCRVVQ